MTMIKVIWLFLIFCKHLIYFKLDLFDEEIMELKSNVYYDTYKIFIQVLKQTYDLTIQLQYSQGSIDYLIPVIRNHISVKICT